jgi:hypothetical protein
MNVRKMVVAGMAAATLVIGGFGAAAPASAAEVALPPLQPGALEWSWPLVDAAGVQQATLVYRYPDRAATVCNAPPGVEIVIEGRFFGSEPVRAVVPESGCAVVDYSDGIYFLTVQGYVDGFANERHPVRN